MSPIRGGHSAGHRSRAGWSLRWALPLRVALVALLVSGCAPFRFGNAPLAHWDPPGAPAPAGAAGRSNELLLLLAFSGGGTRAAAFAYGILEELAATEVMLGGSPRRLLDEVDMISSVSGGSFTAAYFGLYGDRIFTDFREEFLTRNVQGAVIAQLFRPKNWFRLASLYFNRSELAAEYYDDHLFHGATYADLARPGGPEILINATDLSTGGRFTFTRGFFDPICSDLSRYRVAQAVTASSAVPVLFTPVTLENHAGGCGYRPPALPDLAGRPTEEAARLRAMARTRDSYLDASRRQFIHLIDGGISDNLGLRGVYERVLAEGGVVPALRALGKTGARNLVVISINAQTEPAFRWDLQNVSPSLAAVLDAVTSVQINRYNFETVALIRQAFDQWGAALSTPEHPVQFHFIEVSFGNIQDEEELRYFNGLPTSFKLDAVAVDRLRATARRLVRESPDFQALLRALIRVPGSP